jgi:cytochrome b
VGLASDHVLETLLAHLLEPLFQLFAFQMSSSAPNRDQVYAWDPFVRLVHWTLVVAFTTAYLIPRPRIVHEWASHACMYSIGGARCLRLCGAGSCAFRILSIVQRRGLRYMRDLIIARAPRYLGHSPCGGAMVLALLVFLTAAVVIAWWK